MLSCLASSDEPAGRLIPVGRRDTDASARDYGMRIAASFLAALWLAFNAAPSLAHHPGTDLDKVMGSKEKFFLMKDASTPDFTLRDAEDRARVMSQGQMLNLKALEANNRITSISHCGDT